MSPLRATSRLSPLKSLYLLIASLQDLPGQEKGKRPFNLKLEPAIWGGSVTRRVCPEASLT